jgi:hypothetical protein
VAEWRRQRRLTLAGDSLTLDGVLGCQERSKSRLRRAIVIVANDPPLIMFVFERSAAD